MSVVNHSENIIEVRNVSFSYGERRVLENINLTIHRGDYLALIGGNGSGKSTLIKIILHLLEADSGTVFLFGESLKTFSDWWKIGYVPQNATNFQANFPVTVRQVVEMGRFGRRGLFRSPKEEDMQEVEKALRQVDMWEYRDRLVGGLSGGQQQRVFIARALAGKPELILLDEPTVGVEKEVREEFYRLIRKLNEDLDLTVVLVTHDVESVAHEAMHIACIDTALFFHDSAEQFIQGKTELVHPHD